jgi:alkanesulfonate monooxygenase SsuD/methylene tetrahydromethanopterin reductase-like flavin-dependent oxidoreductase (luciferase family)
MRKVWSGDVVEHQSEFLNWTNFKSYPLPVQKPLPVIIGGDKGKILERIAKYGDGWFLPPRPPEEFIGMLDDLKKTCDDIGRDYNEIEITMMWPGQGGKEALAALEAMGVHRAVVPIPALGPNPPEGMEKLAKEVIGLVYS